MWMFIQQPTTVHVRVIRETNFDTVNIHHHQIILTYLYKIEKT